MLDLETYLFENYGICSHYKCLCLKNSEWLGTRCEYWKSCNVTSYKELSNWQKTLHKEYYVNNGNSVGVDTDGEGSSPSAVGSTPTIV